MKNLFVILFFTAAIAVMIAQNATAQVDVTSTGGTSTASYGTLKEAFDAINSGTHTLVINIGISGNTTESASAILNASGSGSASYTSITINPTGGAPRTITGSITGPLIQFNGANNVTIDGLNTGGNSLTISNTATGASSTIMYIYDASANTVQNCTALGSTTSYGVIYFSTGNITGNDNNIINYCNIGPAGSNLPLTGIWSLGTSAAIDNANISITNNNIYDYFSPSTNSRGINITTGNSAWTITNNRLYQTSTRLCTSARTIYGINITTGSGYTISGNIIGFANSSGTGTTNYVGNSVALTGTFPSSYTTTGTANATRYAGISCTFAAGGTESNIQNNTIGGFAFYTSSATLAGSGMFCGINVISGNANIGGSAGTGNIIGSTTGQSSIYVAGTLSGGAVVGIYATTTNTINIQYNNIGALDIVGTTATVAAGFNGICGEGAGGIYTINNNSIGNETADNIRLGYTLTDGNLSNTGTLTLTTGAYSSYGIYNTSTGATVSLNNNTIRGWVTSSSASSTVYGIYSRGDIQTSLTANYNSFGTSSTGWMRYAVASTGGGSLLGIYLSAFSSSLTYNYFSVQNNDFRGLTYSAGNYANPSITFISSFVYSSNGQILNTNIISNNTFTDLNFSNVTTGTITFINHSYNVQASGTLTIDNNSIVGTFKKTTAGAANIYFTTSNSTSVAGATINYTNNNFSNITVGASTAIYGWGTDGGKANRNYTGNTFSNWTCSSGAVTVMNIGISGASGVNGNYVYNNTISNITSTSGAITVMSAANPLPVLGDKCTITGNHITGISASSSGAIIGISIPGGGVASATFTTNIYSNEISTLSSLTGAVTGIKTLTGTALVANIYSNTISSFTSTTGAVIGITSGSPANSVYSNTITGLSTTTTSGANVTGIIVGPGSPAYVYSNIINTFSSAGLTATVAGISSGAATSNVYQNTINKLSCVGTTSGVTNGIMVTNASTNLYLYKNRIYDLTTSGAFSTTPGVNGIVLSNTGATGTNRVYNNLVGELKAPASTSPDAIRGISITSTTAPTFNVYYNTVYITGTGGTGFGTTGIYHAASSTATVAALDFRNNIVVNNCTPSGSGIAVAFRRSSGIAGMLSNYASTSNNNLFYAGTPGTSNLIYYDGTSSAQTISDYKSGVFTAGTVDPRDAASITGDPLFHSLNNLHLMPSSPAINAGAFISGYTTDYDGTTRNATTPTIGAYEQTSNSAAASGTLSNPPASESELIPLTGAGGITFTPTGGLTGNVNGYYFSSGRTGSAPAGIVNISPYYWALSTDISSFNSGLKFYFNNITSNGIIDYTTLKLLRRDGPGSNWSEYSSFSCNANYVQANGVTGFSEWAFGSLEDNPLPVELVSFTSEISGRNIKLKWITSLENNNSGFDVERKSITGIWEKVGYLKGKGTANTPSNYVFEDKNLNAGKYNYRIKQIDVNGNFAYHNLATVLEIGLPDKFNMSQNYPNPFNPTTKIDFDLPADSKINIVLYDMTGREVKTLVNDTRTAGYYTIVFNASGLSSGVYFYRIISKSAGKDFIITKKMTLLK